MGLKKGITTKFGIEAPEAYHRIKSVRGENGGQIRYEVESFFTQQLCEAGSSPLTSSLYYIPDNVSTKMGVVAELYNALKREPDFYGAEDIFEENGIDDILNGELNNVVVLTARLLDGYADGYNVEVVADQDGIETAIVHRSSSLDGVAMEGIVLVGTRIISCICDKITINAVNWADDRICNSIAQNLTITSGHIRQILFLG